MRRLGLTGPAISATALLVSGSLVPADDWPLFRHDPQLTGRSALEGEISQPAVVGEHYVGAWEGWLVATPSPGSQMSASLEPQQGDVQALQRAFGLRAPLYDLRGDGNLVPVAQNTGYQIAKIIPDAPGLQRVEFENAFGYEGGERGHLYSYEPGSAEPHEVWQTPPEPDMFMPLVLLLNADEDDEPEVVVATHYRVMVFDARTGRKDAEIRIHGYRNYGFFGAEDIDHDGRPEYAIITDFSSHVDVVDYEGGELKLLWRRDIDPNLESRAKSVRVGPDPILDVDGDGRFELVFNLFNDTGDEQWHVVAYDALDGSLKWDLPQRFLVGHARLDATGPPHLLTTDTEGLPLPRWGRLRVLQLAESKVQELWRTSRAQWQTWQVPVLPPTRQTGATLGRQTALIDEDAKVLYIRRPGHGDREIVCAVAWNDGDPRETWRCMAPGVEAVTAHDRDGDGRREVLLKVRTAAPGGEAQAAGALLTVEDTHATGARPTSPVAADLDGDGRPEIVVNDDAGGIVALDVERREGDSGLGISERWRVRGRAMADSQTYWYGVQVWDVDGDAQPEIIVGRSNDRGQAELVVLDQSGVPQWARSFPGIDGSDPVWNRGCLTYWAVVDAGGQPAIYASVRRSLMHSDESYLLRGIDGEVIWHQDKIQCPHALRAPGGKVVAAADINGDGWQEVVITYPDVLLVLDGRNGEALVAHPTTGDDLPGWTAYAVPVVMDADRDGSTEILWTACTYLTAAFDATGKVLWHSDYRDAGGTQGCWTLPALADINADGRVELVGSGYTDGLRVYDAATGQLHARADVPPASGPAAAADIDGDGVEEAIIPAGDSLWALNLRDGQVNIVWRLQLPATPFAPIIADLDGDGRGEIAVVCADGFLRIIDDTQSRS